MKRTGKESTANKNNKYAKKTYLFSASLIERLALEFTAFAQEPHSVASIVSWGWHIAALMVYG